MLFRYVSYLREYLDAPLPERATEDVTTVRRRHGVPPELASCHTVVLEGTVVEGHVPAAAVAELLRDESDLDGIALPGMPAGSPGMGGTKRGPFTVYAVGDGRTGEVFGEW
ncbi:DUF411 domain-containing protein [Halosimplex marinum]|uniref:DUF411 domain-containing protein n=1 Tax=Halosimplex marinum TaxID=3396620 RepID=UPI003F548333